MISASFQITSPLLSAPLLESLKKDRKGLELILIFQPTANPSAAVKTVATMANSITYTPLLASLLMCYHLTFDASLYRRNASTTLLAFLKDF